LTSSTSNSESPHAGALVVFDLDGTLIDSHLDLAESANALLAEYGAAPLGIDDIAGMVGDGARMLVTRVLAGQGVTSDVTRALERFLALYDERLLRHTRPYPGLDAIVSGLSGRVPLGILTNKPERSTRRLLDAFDLTERFEWIIGGDGAWPRKPDPAGLHHLIAAARATADRTLLIGDSMVDVETARRAGARMCVALYGFGRMRGDLSLAGDELLAETPSGVSRCIDEFLRGRSIQMPI